MSVVHANQLANVKAVFLKLGEQICNLEFLQILLDHYFNTFQQSFCPTQGRGFSTLVYKNATVACYSLCFSCL